MKPRIQDAAFLVVAPREEDAAPGVCRLNVQEMDGILLGSKAESLVPRLKAFPRSPTVYAGGVLCL